MPGHPTPHSGRDPRLMAKDRKPGAQQRAGPCGWEGSKDRSPPGIRKTDREGLWAKEQGPSWFLRGLLKESLTVSLPPWGTQLAD